MYRGCVVIVGIVGSRTYQDKRKVKDFIFQLRQRFGSELVVLSGGQKDGADYLAKKYSLELDVEYREYIYLYTYGEYNEWETYKINIGENIRNTVQSFQSSYCEFEHDATEIS